MHQTKPLKGWATLLLCLPLACLSQDIQWEKSYGGKQAEYLLDAVATADYGFILAGSSISDNTGNKTSVNKGNLDYWIWKMDEHGGVGVTEKISSARVASDFSNLIKIRECFCGPKSSVT